MNPVVVQFSSDLLSGAFTLALIAGGLLFLGGLVSLGVFIYRSVKGDGMRDPEEVAPEKTTDSDDVTQGGQDDEWEFY
ncbi:hypothetical protein EKH57_15500 [Halorubrum sp. BOL3-1]|uniref:hypothetical protein n=1 Tax=Halorubrum sp. BOL3-1 TaxID=2497325 RepID=UPI0010051447|nr:hypothetical protein [Halorubrum sp. BOL3-1]QAU14000.1 hypothetical protein EKH57_15500 [Halorubrum sp. BOL3-1]